MYNTDSGLSGTMPLEFAVLDLEFQTYQGCLPKFPQVYDVGSVLNTGEEHSTLVKGVAVCEADTALSGITQEMLEGGVSTREALLKLLTFLGGRPVFVWGFPDVTLLSMHLWEQRIPFPRNVFYEARSFLTGLTGTKLPRGLSETCKHLHLTREGEHRALPDARTTLRVINAVVGLKEAAPKPEPCIILEV